MLVFNAELQNSKSKTDMFKHFALSTTTAANRVEGMFAAQERCAIKPDGLVYVESQIGTLVPKRTLSEHLDLFVQHATNCNISIYNAKIEKPLRLNDLWDDDPIASGGLNIISMDSVSEQEFMDLTSLFGPFQNANEFARYQYHYSQSELKKLKCSYKNNRIFQDEYQKRKRRAVITRDLLVPDFELIWLDLTLKLRVWALERGYDSFVYSNKKESTGEDCYICLLPNQTQKISSMTFLADKYLSEVPKHVYSVFERHIGVGQEVFHALWGGKDPSQFWQ
jgi:hypothetical protein